MRRPRRKWSFGLGFRFSILNSCQTPSAHLVDLAAQFEVHSLIRDEIVTKGGMPCPRLDMPLVTRKDYRRNRARTLANPLYPGWTLN
jgi:hypothetical protein